MIPHKRKRMRHTRLLLAGCILLLLAACGKAPEVQPFVQPDEVTITYSMVPTPAHAGEELQLVLTIDGPVTLESSEVYIELKNKDEADKPVRIDFTQDETNHKDFTAAYKFDHAGTYTAVIHSISPELHKISGTTFEVLD